MKGLNTVASPKKRKTCILMIAIPMLLFLLFMIIGTVSGSDGIFSVGIVFGFCMGIYQFYVGKFKKGIVYTITMGMFMIGALIDLFRLLLTRTFKDANGFPLIY